MASVIGLLVAMSLSVTQPLSLDDVLARAESAATAFHRDLPLVVADESYVQVFAATPGSPSITRALRSDLAMATDEDGATWHAFRHVLKAAVHGEHAVKAEEATCPPCKKPQAAAVPVRVHQVVRARVCTDLRH